MPGYTKEEVQLDKEPDRVVAVRMSKGWVKTKPTRGQSRRRKPGLYRRAWMPSSRIPVLAANRALVAEAAVARVERAGPVAQLVEAPELRAQP